MNVADRLRAEPHFSELTSEEASALLKPAKKRSYSSGDILMEEGAQGSSMIIIDSGRVEVRRDGMTLASLDAGATIGEMALLDPAPRSATVVATARTVAYELEREALWGLLATGDEAAIKALQGLTAVVCHRLGDVNQMVQDEVIRPRGNVFSRLWKRVTGKN